MNYWLNLFSGKTWEEFLENGGGVSGFPLTMKNGSKKVKKGDRMICYVTKISRFVGVLDVLSESYEDNDQIIWKGESVFPIRFKVKPIVTVKFEEGIPILSYRDKLKMFESLDDKSNNVGYLVRGSLRKIDREDGDIILQDLQNQTIDPVIREFDRKKLYPSPTVPTIVTSEGSLVTLPPSDEDDGGIETSPTTSLVPELNPHTEIQYLLLRLGSEMGFNVWCARNDKSKEHKGKKFSDISGMMTELPAISLDRNTRTIIENIDVLWFRKNQPVSGFEVESTTSVYSGLLRLSDLIRTVPHINTDLYIVFPDERKDKVLREVNRPTFKEGVSPTLSERVRMISFSDLRDGMRRGEDIGLRYLPPEWVSEELSESCEIDG